MKVLPTDKFANALPSFRVEFVTGTDAAQESLCFTVCVSIIFLEEATAAERAVAGTCWHNRLMDCDDTPSRMAL